MHTIGQLLCFLLVFVIGVTGLTIFVLWICTISLVYAVAAPIAAFMIFYVTLPTLFMFSANIQRHFVYLASARNPPANFDYNDTEAAGLAGCRNFYLFLNEGTEHIGVWHLLPHTLIVESSTEIRKDSFWKESLKSSGKHVIIYFHGNTGTRALDHRKELYWLLQNLDCHIIAFDYRGFADSSPTATCEKTTVEDGILVYNWVREVIGENLKTKIFIWGHSLGTGVSSHVVVKLQEQGDPPIGLILESPFTNIGEALRHNKKAMFYKHLPKFRFFFVSPLHQNGIKYQTDSHIKKILIPILILHAKDDETVPFSLGEKLFNHGKAERPGGAQPIHLKIFPKGHGHKLIHTAPELPSLLNLFIKSVISKNWIQFNCE